MFEQSKQRTKFYFSKHEPRFFIKCVWLEHVDMSHVYLYTNTGECPSWFQVDWTKTKVSTYYDLRGPGLNTVLALTFKTHILWLLSNETEVESYNFITIHDNIQQELIDKKSSWTIVIWVLTSMAKLLNQFSWN